MLIYAELPWSARYLVLFTVLVCKPNNNNKNFKKIP